MTLMESGEEFSKSWGKERKKRTGVFFPQRKAESDCEATEGESLRE